MRKPPFRLSALVRGGVQIIEYSSCHKHRKTGRKVA